ncbi:MAG: hypothetical protein IJR02_04345 [Bacteroidaceae bacterium]|nr:hypothetical protein [Bacteroidaceae bacterium]
MKLKCRQKAPLNHYPRHLKSGVTHTATLGLSQTGTPGVTHTVFEVSTHLSKKSCN